MAAVGSYLMAKKNGGRWLLRLDDLDKQRQVPGMTDDIMRTLESFGLLWDGVVVKQSRHLEEYQEAFEVLQQQGVLYPCCCSRKELVLAASAPAVEDDCIPYPGTCRGGVRTGSPVRSWRVNVCGEELCFDDLRCGQVSQNLEQVCGDFAVRRGASEFTYQLAVVVDDFMAGVNQVVRGEDLLASTPRQIFLQRLLGFPQPEYCHLPLVVGPTGSKLSKRDNLISYQQANVAYREELLLLEVLRFLGHSPPPELAGYSCSDILQWGVIHFKLGL